MLHRILLCLALLFAAVGPSAEEIGPISELLEFEKNPRAVMERTPAKWGASPKSRFSLYDRWSHRFVELKWQQRERRGIFRGSPGQILAAPEPKDMAAELLGRPPLHDRLAEMDSLALTRGELPETPWSGDYWPIAYGILSARPLDPSFGDLESWRDRHDYILKNPFMKIFNEGDEDQRRRLSLAEKLQLLSGDLKGLFMDYLWKEGASYADESGNVEEWMGLCHGWAPASYSTPRPWKAVEMLAFDGEKKLHFYPSEIKGMVTYLWANSPFDTRFVSGRCNSKEPKRDAIGRIIEANCFDTNPATWHLAIVNRLGAEKRSFVMDATFDYEVWNHPVFAYRYRYFHPVTKMSSTKLDKTRIRRSDFGTDPFKEYRSANSTEIVGIVMDVGYIVERGVTDLEYDSPDFDSLTWVRYHYDLELDAEGRIVGGEWYTNKHPDFLFTPEDGAEPVTPADAYLTERPWDGEGKMPDFWQRVTQAAGKQGILPAPLVKLLLNRAQN